MFCSGGFLLPLVLPRVHRVHFPFSQLKLSSWQLFFLAVQVNTSFFVFCLNSALPPAQAITTCSSVSPLFFCFSVFSSSSHLAGCSLSTSGSASSLPPYLLIFLIRTVILFSVASFILVFPITSSFGRVADLLFCLPVCSLLLSVLPPLSSFLLARCPR